MSCMKCRDNPSRRLYRDVAAVPELIDLFSTPSESAPRARIGTYLRGDDLVCSSVVPWAMTLRRNSRSCLAMESKEHRIRTCRHSPLPSGSGTHWPVGEAPALADRCGVAGGAIMISAPLWRTPCISGNMPSWQMISAIWRPWDLDHGIPTCRLPRLDRIRMKFPVVQFDLALVVDDSPNCRDCRRVMLHDRKTAPDCCRCRPS